MTVKNWGEAGSELVGDWTLSVVDAREGAGGQLVGWTLNLFGDNSGGAVNDFGDDEVCRSIVVGDKQVWGTLIGGEACYSEMKDDGMFEFEEGTMSPTVTPTDLPTTAPTVPTDVPTTSPTVAPTTRPTVATESPTKSPTVAGTESPTKSPTEEEVIMDGSGGVGRRGVVAVVVGIAVVVGAGIV